MILIFLVAAFLNPSDGVIITIIDVGQGDATLIEAEGRIILIDGGPKSDAEPILKLLDEKSIKNIDIMILTHPHDDHYDGLTGVLRAKSVGQLWWTGERRGPPRETRAPASWPAFMDAIIEEKLQIIQVSQSMVWMYKGVKIEVLNSGGEYPDNSSGKNINNDSVVFMLSYAGKRVLFPGDIQKDEGDDLVNDFGNQLKCDVIKVPHHGSGDFSNEFIEKVSPKIVLISAGDVNDHAHPRYKALRRYQREGASQFYSTSAPGESNITLSIKPNGMIAIQGQSKFNYWESEQNCNTLKRHDRCLKYGSWPRHN